MRARALVATFILATSMVCPARAEPAPELPAPDPRDQASAPPTETGRTNPEAARRHFQNGIKLFRGADFIGALAEFEAAYRNKPGASSLQNIALCLKELHRYAEAASALETLGKRHEGELNEGERKAVQNALAELAELTATLVVSVQPPDAKLMLDGRVVAAAQRAAGVRVSVGEHTLGAEAAGYQSVSQIARLASGENRKIELRLPVVSGFISVVTTDPDAAIAIDGTPVAFERWRGPVTSGEHYVQVYKPGYESFEKRLTVELGRTELITPPTLPKADDADPVRPTPAANGDPRGLYVLGTLGVMGMLDSPQYLDQKSADVEGSMVGLRGGYRLYAPIAVELMLEGAKNRVDNACYTPLASASESTCPERINYKLTSGRIGPNLRLTSTGASLRFSSTLGVGAVAHQLDYENEQTRASQKLKGTDAYFLIELGAQMNFGHLLLEAAASLYIEGTSSLEGTSSGDDRAVRFDPAVLKMIGIGVRGGFSQWRSPKN